MSTAGTFDDTVITAKSDLAAWIEEGCKPKAKWRIGTEHEKFGFHQETLKPLPYDGDGPTVRKLLEGLAERFDWEPIFEGDNVLALRRNGATIALEPGGQFELSGAPLENVHQTCSETGAHLNEVKEVADAIGAGFLGVGFTPDWELKDIPVMPKARYGIMRAYMPKVGRLGHEMMFRTCTIQVNLDFASEADMVRKLRVALALQPVTTALFANSPFAQGRPSGWLSLRAFAWSDTDPDRTGMLPIAFEDGFGFERYVDWAVDAPMYFLRRNDRFIDVAGAPFRLFMEGRLPGWEGERPTLGDWEDHLSTLFPEARLKRFIETRGADGGPWSRICALPALWTGLLYDDASVQAALDLTAGWTPEERDAMRLVAPRLGLRTPAPGGRSLLDVARDTVAIAERGLKARAQVNYVGSDESTFLSELQEVVDSGVTPAERMLALYHGPWEGDVRHAYGEYAF